MCFARYAEDISHGKHQCSGSGSTCLVRCRKSSDRIDCIDVENFTSFSNELNHFKCNHAADLTRRAWCELETMRCVRCRISCEPGKRAGSSFNSNKSAMFLSSLDCWKHAVCSICEAWPNKKIF